MEVTPVEISKIIKTTIDLSRDAFGNLDRQEVEEDALLMWSPACEELGIPISYYWAPKDWGFDDGEVPDSVKEQLHGKIRLSGMDITFRGSVYMVVHLLPTVPRNELIDASEIKSLAVSPLECFQY